ncbi:MAG TPA: hypothetical protein VLH35_08400 [Candidatus Acidoferrales bacterium]|nr:hypothetical protein [Candidatus Acidoferrales bacterium]
MTCYLRHLGLILTKADITLTKENRKQIDYIIQILVGETSDCPAVWRKVKQRLTENQDALIVELKAAYQKSSKA